MKHLRNIFPITAIILGLVSCANLDSLENSISSLENRVKALEETVGAINDNIIAIQALLGEETRIVGFEQTEGGYTLSLSNGTSVNVIFGDKVSGIVPIVGISENGKWIMSIDGGQTFTEIQKAGPAYGEGGITPVVGIDKDGYWTISYDGGSNFSQILGEDGKPISAVDAGAVAGLVSFFKNAVYDQSNETMVFTLLNDETFSVPVVNNFYLKLEAYQAPYSVCLDQEVIFKATVSDVADAVIRTPEGWSATLTDGSLTVHTPATGTEGIYTVEIILVSGNGLLKRVPLEFSLKAVRYSDTYCKEYKDYIAGNEANLLLDFSYAGYNHGESAPLEASAFGYKVFNVMDYGAIPDDGLSDREAFLKCLKAALGVDYEVNKNNIITFNSKDKANAIVYFPEGEFILHTSADDVESSTASNTQTIQIRSGNFILKGAGRDKTTIVMQAPAQPTDPSILYSSPAMIELKHNSGLSALTAVTANAAKGAYSVQVASTSGLEAGSWVCLSTVNNDPDYVKAELQAGNPTATEMANMTNISNVGVQVYDYHQIKAINGNTVTFVEPIMHEVDLSYTGFTGSGCYNWQIMKYPHYENVGVEDMTFKGFCKDNFVHHGSWEDDGAYKPINMTRIVNSWMRRVGFESVSEACSLTNCANISVYDVTFSGKRGHSAIRAQVSSRVFIGATVDKASGYLIDSPDTYREEAGQYHAVGVSKQSMGTVLWRNTWGNDSCFESHATQPRATLIDCCTGGWMRWRQGGDEIQVPNHLADLTIWNFESVTPSSETFIWWDHSSRWWKFLPPIIVGFHGEPTSFDLSQVAVDSNNGVIVAPESLYEAQLRERLGFVPSWLISLK